MGFPRHFLSQGIKFLALFPRDAFSGASLGGSLGQEEHQATATCLHKAASGLVIF